LSIRSKVLHFSGKVLTALAVTLLLVFLSVFPHFGYIGNASISRTSVRYYGLYATVNYTYNIVYNPLTFPFTWLRGAGISSGDSLMMIWPEGTVYSRLRWPGWREMEADALTNMAYLEIVPNFVMLFVIFIAIEFAKMRLLYIWFITGMIGFISGGFIGTIVGLPIGLFITVFFMAKLDKKVLAKI